jgi:YYY domain-containing protein
VAFGVVAGALRLPRANGAAHSRALVWLWVVGYFVWMGQQWVASMRYFLPLYPALCVLAAGGLVVWRRRRRFAHRRRAGAARLSPPVLAIGAVLVGTTLWALAFHQIHLTLHPYVAATHWMLRHVEAPVSARMETADGSAPLVNWPVAATLGGTAADVVATAVVPADGTITGMRLHRVVLREADPAPTISLELVDRGGRTIGTTTTVELPFGVGAIPGATIDGVELPLTAPAALPGGEKVGLRLVVRGGSIQMSGSRLLQEGPWNDAVPTRVVRLPGSGALDLAGPSGTAAWQAEGIDPFGEGYYVPLDLDMAGEDDARKRTRLLDRLDAGEWLVIPNQRFYGSMTRNPLRFSLATRFYDALFGGELGYSVALVAASPPRLAGVAIPDQALPVAGRPIGSEPWARWMPEEAFSVYDHPAVFVLRKDPGYTRAGAERALAGLELTDVRTALAQPKPALAGRLAWSTAEASVAPDGLLQEPRIPRAVPAANADHAVGGGLSQAIVALAWYALSLLLGICAWPWLAALWPQLPDRGFGVARIAGLVALALPAWWLAAAGVRAWSVAGLAAILCAVAAASATLAWSRWRRGRRLPRPVLRVALVSEIAFAALFAVGIGLRLANPDLWAPTLGGEKPMDFALFNRVLGTDTFPPADPWFSGGRLNYYYFGWVLAGALAKLTGTPASLAYNLALPTWFALTGVAAGALAYNAVALARPRAAATAPAWTAAAVALAAAVLLGNLDLPRALAPTVDAVRHALAADGPGAPDALGKALRSHSERWFWAPSRTVGELPGASHEINEFPAFSFVFGDLHAHLMALPLQLLALCALGGLAASAFATPPSGRWPRSLRLAQVAAAGVPVGLLRATNLWDWPLYLALSMAATAAAAWAGRQRGRDAIDAAAGIAGALVLLLAVQWLVAWPFHGIVTGTVGVHPFDGKATPLPAWLAIQGWFVVAIGTASLALTRRRAPTPPADPRARTLLAGLLAGLRLVRWGGLGATALALLVAAIRGGEVPAVYAQLALVAWLLEVLWRDARAFDERAGLLLAVAGFALAVVVEAVVVGHDTGRMNTFFKFHLQAWMLLAVAAGILVGHLAGSEIPRARPLPWRLPLVLATLVAAAYLPLATYGRSQARFDPQAALTLDGAAFLEYATLDVNGRRLQLADDAKIVRWLRTHAGPDDVLLEAQLPEYQWGSRLSVHTGLPTVLGYRNHQRQQRPLPALADAVELRRQNIPAIYETTDLARKLAALRHYDVRYVAVGGLERAVYPAAGLAAFDELVGRGALELALASGADRVYRVPRTAGPAAPRGPAW